MSPRSATRLVAAVVSLAILAGVGAALALHFRSTWPTGRVLAYRPVDRDRALVVRSDDGSADPMAAYLLLVDRALGPLWSASFRGLQAQSPQAIRVEGDEVRLCAMEGDAPATLHFDLETGQPTGVEPGSCDIHPVEIEVPREMLHGDRRYVQSAGGYLFALDSRTRHVHAAARIEGQDPARHPVLPEDFVDGRLWVASDEGVRVIDAETLRPIGGVAIAPPVVDVTERASRLLPEGY